MAYAMSHHIQLKSVCLTISRKRQHMSLTADEIIPKPKPYYDSYASHMLMFTFPYLFQPLVLLLLDITPMLSVLEGVVMELQDCALPLLRGTHTYRIECHQALCPLVFLTVMQS